MFSKNLNKQQKRNPTNQRQRQSPAGQGGYSYYRGSSQTNAKPQAATRTTPKKLSVNKITRWLPEIPFFLAVGAIIISLLYVMATDMTPKIIVSGDSGVALTRNASDYQAAGKTLLQSSIMNHVKLFIDTKKLRTDFLAKFPELADASVSIPIVGRRPVISLQTSQPALIITGTSGKSFIVNGRGKAVLKAEDASGPSIKNLVKVTDQSGLELTIGKNVLPSTTVDFIAMVNGQFKAKGLAISSINLPTLANEADVHINGLPYMVKFNLLEDARQQSGAYLAVKAQIDKDNIKPVEYVDVRVPEKAYFK